MDSLIDCAGLSSADGSAACQSTDAAAIANQMTELAAIEVMAVIRRPMCGKMAVDLRQRRSGSGCTGWAAAICSSLKTGAGGRGGESISCILFLVFVCIIIPSVCEL